jgi:hypothetical protein
VNDGFMIDRALYRNPKFLACSGLARQIYAAMILECDDEGRELADPITWMRHAALYGPAAATLDQIAGALAELDSVRLAPRYNASGKAYVFLPGRFEHNPTRKYWRRSQHPLPPPELLVEFPEYVGALAMLTTKSERRHAMRAGEARRYPHLAHLIPEFDGQPMGNDGQVVGNRGPQVGNCGPLAGITRESPVEVEVVGKKEGDLPRTEEKAPGRAAPGAAPESPPDVADAPQEARRDQLASPKQQRFAARLLSPHGLTVASWLEAGGHDELLDSHVDEIRERYGGRPEPPTRGPRAHELPQAEDPDMSAEERAASAAVLAKVKATTTRIRSTGNTAGATN